MQTSSGYPSWTARTAELPTPPQRPDVLLERLDEEALLIEPQTGQCHRLNATGLLVWESCDGHTTTRALAHRLADSFDVAFDDALDHVEQVLARLAGAGLFAADGAS